ncbi:pyrroline-5-carboxylate reductase [Dictyocaulus viviparus]|uniref:pyrroline-5-carboxylate reductase n=1 Tax=Dictyocaulus viviparus TaxID=29172 RepID=A0A0D8XX46_DICVI|nr:pyrroline-5-carboxylate reductase [Dictyocaulus viviparus]
MTEFNRLCHVAGISDPMLLFVGGGNMASAIINGCISSGFTTSSEIAISCRSERTFEKWKSQGFSNVFTSTASMIKRFPRGVIILAVKPQSRHYVFASILSENSSLSSCPLLISILAGVSTDVLGKELSSIGFEGDLVRLMPNTAASIGNSATIYSVCDGVAVEKIEIVKHFASKMGICVEVDPRNFNAYAALAGSAPAWAYMFIESLADGGVLAGCSREIALKLAAQSVMVFPFLFSFTFIWYLQIILLNVNKLYISFIPGNNLIRNSKGAAEMVLSGNHPAILKDSVCSPGGTTISGIRKLEECGFRSAVIEAVKAASEKGDTIS